MVLGSSVLVLIASHRREQAAALAIAEEASPGVEATVKVQMPTTPGTVELTVVPMTEVVEGDEAQSSEMASHEAHEGREMRIR